MTDSLVIGAPGRLFAWVEVMLQQALVYVERPIEIVRLDHSSPPPVAPSPGDASAHLFFCNFPHAGLLDWIRAGRLRMLALIDDPHDSLRYRSALAGNSISQTLREHSLAYTAYPCLRDANDVHLIFRSHAGSAVDLIADILDRLDIVLLPEQLAQLVAEFIYPESTESLEAALEAWGQRHRPLGELAQDSAGLRLVDQVLTPLFDLVRGRTSAPIEWPRELFLSGDRPAESLPEVVDLTGPARVICYGPYLYLPPGNYRLAIIMAFSSEVRGLSFLVICTRQLGRIFVTRKRILPPRGGIFAAPLMLSHEQSHDDLEVVIQMERGAIEGRMMLLRVLIERTGDVPRGSLKSSQGKA